MFTHCHLQWSTAVEELCLVSGQTHIQHQNSLRKRKLTVLLWAGDPSVLVQDILQPEVLAWWLSCSWSGLSPSLGNENIGVVLWYLSGFLSNGRKAVSLGSPPASPHPHHGSRRPSHPLRGQVKDSDIFLPANGLVAVFDSDCKASVIWGELTGRYFGK